MSLIIDLRKILGHVRGWEALTWDGEKVLAIYKNKLATRSAHEALYEALTEIVPIVAMKESSTKIVIHMIDRVEATNSFLATYATIAEIAIEELMRSQPLHHLIKVVNDPRTPLHFLDKMRRVVAMKEFQARRDREGEESFDETEVNEYSD